MYGKEIGIRFVLHTFQNIEHLLEQQFSLSLLEKGRRRRVGSVWHSPFVSFRPKPYVKIILGHQNKFCRLLNIKRKLSVFYYIVELLLQIVETNWRYKYCWNYLEIVQMLPIIVKKQMEKGVLDWLLRKFDKSPFNRRSNYFGCNNVHFSFIFIYYCVV